MKQLLCQVYGHGIAECVCKCVFEHNLTAQIYLCMTLCIGDNRILVYFALCALFVVFVICFLCYTRSWLVSGTFSWNWCCCWSLSKLALSSTCSTRTTPNDNDDAVDGDDDSNSDGSNAGLWLVGSCPAPYLGHVQVSLFASWILLALKFFCARLFAWLPACLPAYLCPLFWLICSLLPMRQVIVIYIITKPTALWGIRHPASEQAAASHSRYCCWRFHFGTVGLGKYDFLLG